MNFRATPVDSNSTVNFKWTPRSNSTKFEIHHVKTFQNFKNTSKLIETYGSSGKMKILKKSYPPFLPASIYLDMSGIAAEIRLSVRIALQVLN